MDYAELFKVLAQYAGIGGICVGVLLVVVLAVIRKDIFPRLKSDHAYKIINSIVKYVFAIAVVGIVSWTVLEVADSPKPPPCQENSININTATLVELQSLPYIGPVRAQAIIDYRNENGDFKNIEELDNVQGIGPKVIDGIRSRVCIESGSGKERD